MSPARPGGSGVELSVGQERPSPTVRAEWLKAPSSSGKTWRPVVDPATGAVSVVVRSRRRTGSRRRKHRSKRRRERGAGQGEGVAGGDLDVDVDVDVDVDLEGETPLGGLPLSVFLEIVSFLPPRGILLLATLSKRWAAFLAPTQRSLWGALCRAAGVPLRVRSHSGLRACVAFPGLALLMVGPGGAGKSSLRCALENVTEAPLRTAGVSARLVEFEYARYALTRRAHPTLTAPSARPVQLALCEVGGSRHASRTWPTHYPEAHAVVYVVAAPDVLGDPGAVTEDLRAILGSEINASKPLLILVTKQDQARLSPSDFVAMTGVPDLVAEYKVNILVEAVVAIPSPDSSLGVPAVVHPSPLYWDKRIFVAMASLISLVLSDFSQLQLKLERDSAQAAARAERDAVARRRRQEEMRAKYR